MNFDELVKKTSNLPCFTTRFLAAGQNLAQVRLQLNRWVKDGRVIRLHRGLYCLSEPYCKINTEPFCIANSLKSASYVSLQSALAWYGLIPEYVPVVTNVITGRPQTVQTPVGRFVFRHIRENLFWGYHQVTLSSGQTAFIARPEKALLDLIYLTPEGETPAFLEELRLQNIEKMDAAMLRRFAEQSQSPKLRRAVDNLENILKAQVGVDL
jgi:predicted transcriptional regulator of viral defense system